MPAAQVSPSGRPLTALARRRRLAAAAASPHEELVGEPAGRHRRRRRSAGKGAAQKVFDRLATKSPAASPRAR